MSNTHNRNLKNTISKGLFAVVLLLSIFTFSGLVTQKQCAPVKQQTTLLVSSNTKLAKTIAYNRLLVKSNAEQRFAFHLTDLSRLHSLQTRVRFNQLSNFNYPSRTSLFYRAKTIPQNPGDDVAIFG